jgi:hypothetical protein
MFCREGDEMDLNRGGLHYFIFENAQARFDKPCGLKPCIVRMEAADIDARRGLSRKYRVENAHAVFHKSCA